MNTERDWEVVDVVRRISEHSVKTELKRKFTRPLSGTFVLKRCIRRTVNKFRLLLFFTGGPGLPTQHIVSHHLLRRFFVSSILCLFL